MSESPVIALDVGGSSIKSGLVATGPRILGGVQMRSIDSRAGAAEILQTLAAVIAGHFESCRDARGIAIAFPGPFDYEQGICLMRGQEKYDALYGINLSAGLKEIPGMPDLEIRYRNDAEAAIVGEALYGAGGRFSRLLGVTLGTGLGSAFLSDGAIITEGAGVPDHGWLYSQPSGTGNADDMFSSRGLLARLRGHGIRAADLASAISMTKQEDQALRAAFASFGMDLGTFLKPFVSDFRADGVLVTGGIAEAWDWFGPALVQSLTVPVVKGTLGKAAPLVGGAALYLWRTAA